MTTLGAREVRIGFLIPEFPGQTHNFFWREIAALADQGVSVSLYSTKQPPSGVKSTSWGEQAASNTVYLYPPSFQSCLGILWCLAMKPRRALNAYRAWRDSLGFLLATESPSRLLALMMLGISLGVDAERKGIRHIHIHSCADAANIAFFMFKTFGITYSLTLHNPISIWGGNQENKWAHASFAIIIAEWIKIDLVNKIPNHLPVALHIAPMGVDTRKFQRASPYQPWNEGQLRIASCGRLNPAKGFSTLLNAIRIIKKQGIHVNLTIAGEDDHGGSGYRKEIEASIERLQLNDNVTLLGAVSEERVKQELERAHIFVLASIEEPLGVAIMEAMAMEVPVISTNAGGVPELLGHDHGLMIPPSDEIALSEAILSLIKNPRLATNLSRRGRELISRRFHHQLSAQVIASEIRKLGV